MAGLIVVQGQADLFQMVFALNFSSGFSRSLNGRQKQGDQRRDDRDHDEQLNQSKSGSFSLAEHIQSFAISFLNVVRFGEPFAAEIVQQHGGKYYDIETQCQHNFGRFFQMVQQFGERTFLRIEDRRGGETNCLSP